METWLRGVERIMRLSLKSFLEEALASYPADKNSFGSIDRKSWLFEAYPAQIILLVDQIYWTRNVELAVQDADETVQTARRAEACLNFSNSQFLRLNLWLKWYEESSRNCSEKC